MSTATYPCYVQTKDTRGQWYWIYYGKNREEIARSSESYVNKSDCERGIELVKNSKSDPVLTR